MKISMCGRVPPGTSLTSSNPDPRQGVDTKARTRHAADVWPASENGGAFIVPPPLEGE
jgi:hypothetical protein